MRVREKGEGEDREETIDDVGLLVGGEGGAIEARMERGTYNWLE